MHLLGIVAYWVICLAIAGAVVRMAAGAIVRERRRRQRLRGYEVVRQARDAAHWQQVMDMLPGSAADTSAVPSQYDPYLVDQPRTPQQGGCP